MKYVLCFPLLVILGYGDLAGQDLSKHHTKQEMVRMTSSGGESYNYSRDEFNKIVDNHPEFFTDYPVHPDLAYACQGDAGFTSELGKDQYYILYAYFLRQKNSIYKFAQQRQRLIDLYAGINSLFQKVQYGGTYFGHQSRRIEGCAEYAVYSYAQDAWDREKTYDVSPQKKLYIQSLRQLVDDEVWVDGNIQGKPERAERARVLNRIVDEIDVLITDLFYLRQAQAFQYQYYQ